MKTFLAFLFAYAFSVSAFAQASANLVLLNGKIWTVNDRQPALAEAVAFACNRAAAVGSSKEIR